MRAAPLLIVLAAGAAGAAPPPAPVARAALEEFLGTDCEHGAQGAALVRLFEHAESLTPELIRILRDGPGPQALESARLAAQAAWTRRQQFLAEDPPLGLTDEQRMRVQLVDPSPSVERELLRVDRGRRERALAALEALATPEALRAIRGAARRAEPELAALARQALERMGAPLPGPRRARR